MSEFGPNPEEAEAFRMSLEGKKQPPPETTETIPAPPPLEITQPQPRAEYSAVWPPLEPEPAQPEKSEPGGGKEAVTEDKEVEKSQTLEEVFPELAGEGHEQTVVREVLLQILESGQFFGSPEEIRHVIHAGITFVEEDQELPEEYQPEDPTAERLKYVAGARNGRLFVFPEFFTPKYDNHRQHILAHELGETVQERRFERKTPEGFKLEHLFDREKHNQLIEQRKPEWNGMYVEMLHGRPNGPFQSEARADDLACYFNAKDPMEWMKNRIATLKPEKQAQLKQELDSGGLDDEASEVSQLYAHAQEVYRFLDGELNTAEKKAILKETAADYDGEEFSGLYGGGFEHVAMNSQSVDPKLLDKFYDLLFGVRTSVAG